MTTYDLALTGIKNLLSCGYYICIKIPASILKMCWKAQMFMLSLPYRCLQSFLCAVRSSVSGLVELPIRAVTQQILQEFLTKQSSEKNFLESGSPAAEVRGADVFDNGFHLYKNKAELEQRIEEETAFAKEEKKLLRMTLAALKYLKRLKGTTAVLDEQFRQTLEDLINISRSLCQKREINEPKEESGFNGNPRSKHKLQKFKQATLLRDVSEKRQDVYYGASLTSPSKFTSTKEFINAYTLRKTSVTDSELVCISMEALQSVIYALNAENFALRRRLKLTNDQLGGFKTTSKCLAGKVTDLEVHLQKTTELLKITEEERDEMCFKLFSLSDIIEEQETLLNNSTHRNNMDALYNTTLDYLLSEVRGTEEANFD